MKNISCKPILDQLLKKHNQTNLNRINQGDNMKYHIIKKERYNTRENGSYASYPVYEHKTGDKVAVLECYSDDVDRFLSIANTQGNVDFKPFWK